MIGPCFGHPRADPAACRRPITAQFAWFARDDAAPDGRVLIVVCMACDAILQNGAPATPTKRKRKTRKAIP